MYSQILCLLVIEYIYDHHWTASYSALISFDTHTTIRIGEAVKRKNEKQGN